MRSRAPPWLLSPYGETNDQSRLRVGRADRNCRIHNAGHGRAQPCRGPAGHDQGSYGRYGLCAGSRRRRVCLGSIYCPAVHAQYRYRDVPIATNSRAGRPRQPDCVGKSTPVADVLTPVGKNRLWQHSAINFWVRAAGCELFQCLPGVDHTIGRSRAPDRA